MVAKSGDSAHSQHPTGSADWPSAGVSISGRQRDHNEDAICVAPGTGLWAVADGMGGHSAGDVASRLVVERLQTATPRGGIAPFCEQVEGQLLEVNRELQERSGHDSARLMGSTVVFLLARDGLMLCGWVGDSRAYRLREGVLVPLSRDHSHVQQLIEQGEITAAEARIHPDANIVTRAVGGEARLVVDYHLSRIKPKDRFLLCSDGVDKELDDQQILKLLRDNADPALACERLSQAADHAGGRDNISCVIVDVPGTHTERETGNIPDSQAALAALCDDLQRQRINYENFRIRRARLLEEVLDPQRAQKQDVTIQMSARQAHTTTGSKAVAASAAAEPTPIPSHRPARSRPRLASLAAAAVLGGLLAAGVYWWLTP